MSKKQKSTTQTTPYSGDYKNWVYDYKNQLWQRNNTPATAYSGQLNATTNATQNTATSNINNLTNTAALNDTISGKYVDPASNPYLRKYYDAAASNIDKSYGENYDAIDSKFGKSSFWGGSQHQKSMQNMANQEQQAKSDLATNIYGGAYNQERTNQMNAINQASNLYNNQYNIGQSQYDNEQNALANTYSEWIRQQGVDENDMNRIMQLLGLVKNPSSSTTASDGGASFGSALGSLGAAAIICFAAGTMISTPDGDKPIEEIKEGYIVNTPTGTGLVINTKTGREYSVTIECEKGTVITTPTQPFLTAGGWKTPTNIRPGDEVNGKVRNVTFGKEKIVVYDITVDGDNVFYANGFTVEGGFTKEGE
ncbi:MAG: Hint domain-containing protein [Bacillota bacterium]